MEELKDQLVSVMVDGCSKEHHHYIGVNVQFIKDKKTIVRTLAVANCSKLEEN